MQGKIYVIFNLILKKKQNEKELIIEKINTWIYLRYMIKEIVWINKQLNTCIRIHGLFDYVSIKAFKMLYKACINFNACSQHHLHYSRMYNKVYRGGNGVKDITIRDCIGWNGVMVYWIDQKLLMSFDVCHFIKFTIKLNIIL